MAVRELETTPTLRRLYARAVATGFGRHGDTLPDLEVVLRGVAVDREHLAAYAGVCEFRVSDVLPPTYPHVLAFPLAMELMSDRRFPFPVVGLVHVANRVVQPRPVAADEVLDLHVRACDLRPHAKGVQFDVHAEARSDDEPVWTGVSTYLRRRDAPETSRSSAPRLPSGSAPTAVWHVDAAAGRRYATVSGDRNPIHLHGIAAKALGFPRAIAHGMWTKARCLAAFEGRLPDAFTATTAFRAPVTLPSVVEFSSEQRDDTGWTFEVRDTKRGRLHLAGTLDPKV
ncbi:MAG: MaoC family dehydratase [Actinomycetes bacterium]